MAAYYGIAVGEVKPFPTVKAVPALAHEVGCGLSSPIGRGSFGARRASPFLVRTIAEAYLVYNESKIPDLLRAGERRQVAEGPGETKRAKE